MVEQIVIDNCVIVATLLDKEKKLIECRNLLEKVKTGEYIAVEPYIVLVEIVAAIKRRAGSSYLADRVKQDLCDINTIVFLDITSTRAREMGVGGAGAVHGKRQSKDIRKINPIKPIWKIWENLL